jgi:Flp pilus assembly protein TadB
MIARKDLNKIKKLNVMNDIIIKISDNLLVEKILKKKIFIDDKFVFATRSNLVKISKEDNQSEIKIEILGGFYSTEFSLSKNTSYSVFCENKDDKIGKFTTISICLLLILEIINFHFVPTIIWGIVLWGNLLFWFLLDLIKRKKRYKVKIYEM